MMSSLEPFLIGGLSGMTATTLVQPIDMVKVRIQIKNEGNHREGVSAIAVIKETYATGGCKTFYKGIDSALMRQLFYTTTRLGVYRSLFTQIKNTQGRDPTLLQKAGCSVTAGFVGSIVGNPADLVLIRMQNDSTIKEVSKRRGYTNFFQALRVIVSQEGVLGLWRGCTPTVVRAVSLNLGMLAPYDEIKERLPMLHPQNQRLAASAGAGFLAAFMSLPFDNAKTKMQKMVKVDGQYPYKNICDCMAKTMKQEGLGGLWVGFPTYYVRIAPHAMITLLLQDYLSRQMALRRASSF